MPGAPLPLVAVRLAVVGKRAGAARFPLAAPRALAFGSRAAAPRTFGRATTRAPRRRRCAPRPGASAHPPLRPCAAGLRPARRATALGPQSGRTSAPRPPGAGGAAPAPGALRANVRTAVHADISASAAAFTTSSTLSTELIVPSYYNIRINFTRNSVRHIPHVGVKRARARLLVKFFLAPPDSSHVITEETIADELVTDSMIDRYLVIEPPQTLVMPEFDTIVNEIERTYVFGFYFSALSAACVSIERTLNLLRINLHPFHPGTAAEIEGLGPIDNWKKNIDALVQWGYLQEDDSTALLRKQYFIRSKYLHSGSLNELPAHTLTSINVAYDLLKKTLAFPDSLFTLSNGGIRCKDPAHPLFLAFYKPIIVTTPDETPRAPQV
jgi:hypothetical protein